MDLFVSHTPELNWLLNGHSFNSISLLKKFSFRTIGDSPHGHCDERARFVSHLTIVLIILNLLQVKKAAFIITQDNEKEVLDTLRNEIRRMNKLTNDETTKLTGQIDTLNEDVSALKCNNQKEFEKMRDDVMKNDEEVSKVMI